MSFAALHFLSERYENKAKEGIDNVQKVTYSHESNLLLFVLTVSWADLIAVAGAEAVALCGGPEIPVRLGRLDSR